DLRDWSQWWTWQPGADWRHPGGPGSSIDGKDDYPVVQVSWEDAVAYTQWAGGRLPTEAEWEYAARGGLVRKQHAWGDDAFDPTKPHPTFTRRLPPTAPATPKPVKSFPANGYGLYDMSGNVWQWTADWYRPDTYQADQQRGTVSNPTGPAAGLDPRDGAQATR